MSYISPTLNDRMDEIPNNFTFKGFDYINVALDQRERKCTKIS